MNKLLIILALLLLPVLSFAQEWTIKDWNVQPFSGGRVLFYAHGTVVHGHQFGFLKNTKDCDTDILLISLGSFDKKVKDFDGEPVTFSIEVDGVEFQISVNVFSKNTGSITIMTFTNFVAKEDFTNFLIKGNELNLKIVEPKEFIKYFDMNNETFSLIGFTAARKKAKDYCEETKNRGAL
ncbi:MAG: hypothetical protein PHY73_05450 [Candidatus Omnitrophica bacterium]|nr:hypothetical protein [Candidatus Omnitrophota bacterium]